MNHLEYLKRSETLNAQFCVQHLQRVYNKLCRKFQNQFENFVEISTAHTEEIGPRRFDPRITGKKETSK